MVQKPEIQYVGQFYVHGSEARETAARESRRKSGYLLPAVRPNREHRIYVDPVALCAMAVAVVMLVALALGAVRISESWHEYDAMERYLSELKKENSRLEQDYRSGYDLEEIRASALAIGMVPASEVKVIPVRVTLPEPEPERSVWQEVTDFLRELLGKA